MENIAPLSTSIHRGPPRSTRGGVDPSEPLGGVVVRDESWKVRFSVLFRRWVPS